MKKRKRIWTALKPFLLILPFFLGLAGYFCSGKSLLDATYDSIGLYTFGYDAENWNILLGLARWLAPAATCGAFFLAFGSLYWRLRDAIRIMSGKATSIYGGKELSEAVRKATKRPVLGGEKVNGAKSHIIVFDTDEKSLKFYVDHIKDFTNKQAFIHLDNVSMVNMRAKNLRVFNVTDMTARMYWKKHPLLSYYKDGGMNAKIALLGFGHLGQRLLDYGLLNNIYSPNQHIEYHIWGDSTRYAAIHTQLASMAPDTVVFHEDTWERDNALLETMNRIIVAEEAGNMLSLLDALVMRYHDLELHVYDPSGGLSEQIFLHSHLSAFGESKNILSEENIKTDLTYRTGKQLNYRYYLLYGGETPSVENKERVMEEQWDALDGFTKFSNLAAADYHSVRLQMIDAAGKDGIVLTQQILNELEHMRWCRYHYLHNWQYGIPKNGKPKDTARRIHSCLVPFDELSDADKEKDAEMIQLLMELNS